MSDVAGLSGRAEPGGFDSQVAFRTAAASQSASNTSASTTSASTTSATATATHLATSASPGHGGKSAGVVLARQALAKAQGRVDADKAAHSPSCVALDQKGVNAATASLAAATADATRSAAGSSSVTSSGATAALSIVA